MNHATSLLTIRARLQAEEALMRQGIQTDPDTGLSYFTGYAYKTLYDWDQYFEALVQIYMGWGSTYIKNAVLIFLEHQQPSGLISRSVPSNNYHDPEHVKPFLAQIAWLVQQTYGECEWILSEPHFTKLQRYLDYWLTEMDADGNGMSEWMSAPHTGMDNQHERAGYWLDRFCEGVDLNSYLVREARAFAQLATLAGKNALASTYYQQADERAERVRTFLWNEEDGFFYDRNIRFQETVKSQHAGWGKINEHNDERIRVKSVAAFAALWAGIATPEQARRMITEHLFNAREFWSPYPIATLARSERWYSQDAFPGDLGCSWRANTWVPANFIVYRGLRHYGYRELASLVAHATENLVHQSGNREYYDAETGVGRGLDPFWGWSLLAYFMPHEEASSELPGEPF